jgi:hypothetical protein
MKFETVLKTWQVEKSRLDFRIDLMHDFTVRSTSKYRENLLNPNAFLTDWFGFSSDKNQEIEIIIEILALMPLAMMSPAVKKMAIFYSNYNLIDSWKSDQLRPDQEFFFGPRIHSLSLEERNLIKRKYVDLTSGVFSLADGFILLNYDSIQLKREVQNDSGGEDYFLIQKGKVTYGGYDGANSGGSGDWDLESVYYWPEDVFNLLTNHRFKGLQAEIQSLFESNVIK